MENMLVTRIWALIYEISLIIHPELITIKKIDRWPAFLFFLNGYPFFFSLSYYSSNSNEAVSNYVQHVFVMAPGMLTLLGSLMVLFLQPSGLGCNTKGWSLKRKKLQCIVSVGLVSVQTFECPKFIHIGRKLKWSWVWCLWFNSTEK